MLSSGYVITNEKFTHNDEPGVSGKPQQKPTFTGN